MTAIQTILSNYILTTLSGCQTSKKIKIYQPNEETSLYVFDWERWNKGIGTRLYSKQDVLSDADDIREYFMEFECEEMVEDNKLLPFGLLGISYNSDSFAQLPNNGLLLFDLTSGNKNDPPVILFKDDSFVTVASKFSDLNINQLN